MALVDAPWGQGRLFAFAEASLPVIPLKTKRRQI